MRVAPEMLSFAETCMSPLCPEGHGRSSPVDECPPGIFPIAARALSDDDGRDLDPEDFFDKHWMRCSREQYVERAKLPDDASKEVDTLLVVWQESNVVAFYKLITALNN